MRSPPDEATAPLVDAPRAERWAEWASSAEAQSDPYYSEARCRFELRDDDALRTVGDIVVGLAECGAAVSCERARVRLEVCGVDPRDASAVFAAIDGVRTASEVSVHARVGGEVCRKLWERTFGTLVLAPRAIADLDHRVSAAEIVRYPGSPYEIVRTYWANMGDVADRLEVAGSEIDTPSGFIRLLRELNVIALAGVRGDSFYLPASPVAAKGRVQPGELWTAAAVVEPGAGAELRFVSGPRVNASPIGGPAYQRLLATTLADPGAGEPTREFVDATGLHWGRTVVARADSDELAAPWFCPPRPLEGRHLEALCAAFTAARAAAGRGDAAAAVRDLAAFHQRFIRLHPFRAGNQCLAMSFVNHVLRKSHGAGMSHLVLDHLALQLSPDAYTRAFGVAVAAWLVATDNPVERHLELIARRAHCFDFLRKLGETADHAAAVALTKARPDDARLAMIDPAALPLSLKP